MDQQTARALGWRDQPFVTVTEDGFATYTIWLVPGSPEAKTGVEDIVIDPEFGRETPRLPVGTMIRFVPIIAPDGRVIHSSERDGQIGVIVSRHIICTDPTNPRLDVLNVCDIGIEPLQDLSDVVEATDWRRSLHYSNGDGPFVRH